jgi:endonuclease YncB( thermonuclease family)
MRWPTLAACSLFSLALIANSEAARQNAIPADETITGPARILDGDTIDITGTRVRLYGIDAPEMGQKCRGGFFGSWRCGSQAASTLARLIDRRDVRCERRGIDKYGRTLARCFIDTTDLAGEMVRRGMAWAFTRYSQDYVAIEQQARAARVGIWRADNKPAWDYRASQWQDAVPGAPNGCAIKGNVNARGERIYHMPWQPFYGKVRMDATDIAARGKRWFCNETEALAAGWRPAYVR